MKNKKLSDAFIFITLLGIVSMFSDMTHEGASSIRGAYLLLLGASASTIGFISGLGELVGYGLRYFFGKLTDKSKKYWELTIIGYAIDVLAVPALALVNEDGWILACFLLILERTGKAIKKPAKNTILSFAASVEGSGKSFAYQEALDQFGAFVGPLLLYVVMLFKKGSMFNVYQTCFAFLTIPAFICLFVLIYAKRKFPHPENFEKDEGKESKIIISKNFIYYLIGIAFFAFGFIDFSLITMHVVKINIFDDSITPLLYSLAMLLDALSALFFGNMFDSKGITSLMISTIISSLFSIFIFGFNNKISILIGICLWGIGMGAQESILKAAVSKIVNKENRGQGYGIFEFVFGLSWFLGSWLLGTMYDVNIYLMIAISFIFQIMAVIMYYKSNKIKQIK